MISNIEELKAELLASKIVRYDDSMKFYVESKILGFRAMKGCSESEVLELEAKYGKFPLSYRQILKTIGHRAGCLIEDDYDTHFYISSTIKEFDNSIICANEEYREYREEAIENKAVVPQ